jgi:hypothetical protein
VGGFTALTIAAAIGGALVVAALLLSAQPRSAPVPSSRASVHFRMRDDVPIGERSRVEGFLDVYRAAFERLDAAAIAELFTFPCQITSDGDEITVTTVATREAWFPQLERLVDAYRSIGVRSAEILDLRVIELTPRLAQATVRWRLADGTGESVYDFGASYTLVEHDGSTRVAAIAHDETSALRRAIELRRVG